MPLYTTFKAVDDNDKFELTLVKVNEYDSDGVPTPDELTVILAVGVGFPINPLNPPSTA
jgi:hypothetical protein